MKEVDEVEKSGLALGIIELSKYKSLFIVSNHMDDESYTRLVRATSEMQSAAIGQIASAIMNDKAQYKVFEEILKDLLSKIEIVAKGIFDTKEKLNKH